MACRADLSLQLGYPSLFDALLAHAPNACSP